MLMIIASFSNQSFKRFNFSHDHNSRLSGWSLVIKKLKSLSENYLDPHCAFMNNQSNLQINFK